MNIAIDGRVLENKQTGIGRMIINIWNEINRIDDINKYYLITYEKYGNVERNIYKKCKFAKYKQIYSIYWTNIILPKILKENNIDLYISAKSILPIKKICKSMLIVPDALTKVSKKYFSLIFRIYVDIMKKMSILKSDAILTISINSKKDVVNYYGIGEDKIDAIYLAADKIFKPISISSEFRKNILEKYGLPNEFILYVGRIEKRKNIEGIIEIFKILRRKNIDIGIVLIGRLGHGAKRIIKMSKNVDQIRFISYVNDLELSYIYNLAKIFLFPSFYEGFGLPVLEAMQSGTPVIVSNKSSLPEIVGKAAKKIDPNNYMEYVYEIEMLLNNLEYYNIARYNAIERAKLFSWENTAKEIIERIKNNKNNNNKKDTRQ